MPLIRTIEDLQTLARRRVPKMFYDYAQGGSWTESTSRANLADLSKIQFRQRIGVNIEKRNLATQIVGQSAAMPVVLGPIGMCGLQRADGEILAARAAEASGVPFCLSTMSICSIEDLAQHVRQPFWFQLYIMRDRSFVEKLIMRAHDAKCTVLIVTMDLQILGERHKDLRNGLAAPPKLTPQFMLDLLLRPHWALEMLQTRRRGFGNIVGHVSGVKDMASLSAWTTAQFDPSVTWEDVAWIRKLWKGKLIIKGVMDSEDARKAIDAGADGLVISNHGGRQLDGAPSSISVLPQIKKAVGADTELLFDGGVRSGQDVLRALALGAHGVLLGRAYLYGLGALGQEGVRLCLEIIERELSLTLGFCGRTDVRSVDETIVVL
ncbi:MAG: alpha-hydroxy-acid oxidizing protein [Methylocystaceae bacterium]|jgi:L-lactate dehydrogenase (cytochrome)|nr:alpha-hydroxy-acid oxidizing protein [Methylocystaceae bacterium]NBT96205.1 alpha-hydroxy-acid oxidizing protein [Methylocystaceae bacterium]